MEGTKIYVKAKGATYSLKLFRNSKPQMPSYDQETYSSQEEMGAKTQGRRGCWGENLLVNPAAFVLHTYVCWLYLRMLGKIEMSHINPAYISLSRENG